MSTLREAVERASAAGWPLIGLATPRVRAAWSGHIGAVVERLRDIEEAEYRLRRVCAVLNADPEPFLKAAGGNPHTLETMYRSLARDGSSALSALAAELADA